MLNMHVDVPLGWQLHALEDFTCVHQHVSFTSRLQMWNQPRKHVVDTADVSDFVKLEYGKQKRKSVVSPSVAVAL